MYTFGVIGMGNMGLCILNGALSCNIVKPSQVIIFDLDEQRVKIARDKGFTVAKKEEDVYTQSEYVLFAIIPQLYEDILKKLSQAQTQLDQTILTIAPGITSEFIQTYLGSTKKVIRVMPNTPLTIGCGATALSKTDNVTDTEFGKIKSIFEAMGEVAVIDESLMTEIIPANGSAPAFIYYFINCFADALEKQGIKKDLAVKLLSQSAIGSARMLLETGLSPEELIDQVCSPGGVTIETINVFNSRNLSKIVEEGCNACIKRGYELKK